MGWHICNIFWCDQYIYAWNERQMWVAVLKFLLSKEYFFSLYISYFCTSRSRMQCYRKFFYKIVIGWGQKREGMGGVRSQMDRNCTMVHFLSIFADTHDLKQVSFIHSNIFIKLWKAKSRQSLMHRKCSLWNFGVHSWGAMDQHCPKQLGN